MLPARFLEIKTRIACGEWACIRACSCAEITSFVNFIREFSDPTDVALVLRLICPPVCEVPPVDTTPQPQPPQQSCVLQLRAAVCTDNVIAGINTLQLVISGLTAINPTPNVTRIVTVVGAMLEQLEEFCANPTGGTVERTMRAICVQWPLVRTGIDQLAQVPLLNELTDALRALFINSSLGRALDACCAANGGAPGRDPLPPTVAPENPGQTSSRPDSTQLVRVPLAPIGNAIAQGPRSVPPPPQAVAQAVLQRRNAPAGPTGRGSQLRRAWR